MFSILRLLIFLVLLLIGFMDSAKILIISPSLSKSLIMVTGRIADALVESGHNVVSKNTKYYNTHEYYSY